MTRQIVVHSQMSSSIAKSTTRQRRPSTMGGATLARNDSKMQSACPGRKENGGTAGPAVVSKSLCRWC